MDPNAPTAAVPPPIDGAAGYAQLKAAVLGAQADPAAASPLGSFPELAKLYSSAPVLARQQLSSAAPNYNAGVQADNEAEARRLAAAEAAQRLKDLQDPSKYQQIQKADGGYAFYDPTGKEISAVQYAAVHNTTPDEVLKHSQNPIDLAYREDFKNLQNYINNKLRSKNSTKAADTASAVEAQVKQAYGIDLNKMSPQDLIQTFQKAYPTVYGGTHKGVPASTTFIPNGGDLYSGA